MSGYVPRVVLDSDAGAVPRRRRPGPVGRLLRRLRQRGMPQQGVLLLWLTALALVVALGARAMPDWIPASSMVLVLMLGGFFLRLRSMLLLYVVAFAGLVYAAYDEGRGLMAGVTPGVVLLVLTIALLVALWVNSRERLGLQGTSGDTMLVDLRDRLRSLGKVPPLPPSWHMEVELRPAFGDSFSGDFVITAAGESHEDVLEVVLVDVSGKGQQAGSRSLLLSGALGGLLGSVPPEQFLPLANGYLLRQDWAEGFATAAHLRVDLTTGAYRLAVAGHPPAATGRGGEPWQLLDGDHGPALGLLPVADYPVEEGVLGHGEALVMYTDGLVEQPGVDLYDGIDALVAQASAVGADGWGDGAASRVVDAVRAEETDDRALVLVWRD